MFTCKFCQCEIESCICGDVDRFFQEASDLEFEPRTTMADLYPRKVAKAYRRKATENLRRRLIKQVA